MPRFKLTLEYAGTRYSGWQIQKNARTVQGELARAVTEVTGRERFDLHGAGRTDAGVHALAQVAHLDIATTLPPATLGARLNDSLPADVNVRQVETTGHRFHARRDAVARRYVYQLARRRTAFAKPFVWWVREPLAVDRMRDAAAGLVGFHDFQSFTDDDADEKSTTVALTRLDVVEREDLLLIDVLGSHFLWKMVRRLTGVLVEAGIGRLTTRDVARFFETRSPLPAKLTAPASGLFLARVYYPGDSPGEVIVPPVSL